MMMMMMHSTKGPTQLKPAFTFAVGNVINTMVVGYAWKFGDQKMEEFRKTLEELPMAATKPTVLLLELHPWIRYFEPPFNIGLKHVKHLSDMFRSFFLEEIRKHKEMLNENEPPRDYTEAYLIDMNKRIKAGNQGDYRIYENSGTRGNSGTCTTSLYSSFLEFFNIMLLHS
uniref:Uncharacterized protein n=1 Tax=Plectus sambesii TaxID=2011161 RepID=A0A914XMW4_9BILA